MSKAGSRMRLTLLLLIAVAVLIALVFAGIVPRLRARQTLQKQTAYQAAPTVSVVRPKPEAMAQEVVLPGSIQAFTDAPIYARTSGYLKKWYHDIGSRVQEGELLAEIESPEVDRQLQQSREDVDTAQANLKLAQITAARYTDLLRTDSVAKQEVDTAVQDAAARASTLKSAQANVQRLEQMAGFEKVYAPFTGVITVRNTDVGQLIEAGSSGGPGRELFHISALDKLRVFVNVPQIYSHEAMPGMKADLTLPEMPGKRFTGTLTRTARAFDPATRTLLVEVDVPNNAGQLYPGAYTEVHLKVKAKEPALLIPATALTFRADGLRAATVVNNHAALVPVTLGRDFGNEVEVVAGLSQDAQVILSPPDSLVEGEAVRIVGNTPKKEAE